MIFSITLLSRAMISSSFSPRVVWLETWNRFPIASVPSPYRPRTARPILLTAWMIWLIWSLSTSAGRWTIAEARMPVPTLVGQAVR